jgi:hypothetical protein
MRADVVGLGLAITLLSTSLAHGQVIIDVSKVTCDQFAQGKIGEPRTTAVWLNGYYHGKNGSTTIDTQRSEAIFGLLKITEAIAPAVEPQIYAAESFRARRKPPDSMDASDH